MADGSEEKARGYAGGTLLMAIAAAAAWVAGGLVAGFLMPPGMKGRLLGLPAANVVSAAVAITLAPRRCWQVGLPAVLLWNGCGLAALLFFSQMMDTAELLNGLGMLVALGYAPGLLMLWGGQRLHSAYGRRGSLSLALGAVVLVYGGVFASTVPYRTETARLEPLKADVARWLSEEVLGNVGELQWRTYRPSSEGGLPRLQASAGDTYVILDGVPPRQRFEGLSDLVLERGAASLAISFRGLGKKSANTGDPNGRGTASVAAVTPKHLAQLGLMREELAKQFRKGEETRFGVPVWEAQRDGLVLRYEYNPPRGFVEIEVRGKYRGAVAPSGLKE